MSGTSEAVSQRPRRAATQGLNANLAPVIPAVILLPEYSATSARTTVSAATTDVSVLRRGGRSRVMADRELKLPERDRPSEKQRASTA
jgi:hypothetical protein